MEVPGDETREGGQVVAAAGEALVDRLLHKVLVHALHDEPYNKKNMEGEDARSCLLYTSPSPRD